MRLPPLKLLNDFLPKGPRANAIIDIDEQILAALGRSDSENLIKFFNKFSFSLQINK